MNRRIKEGMILLIGFLGLIVLLLSCLAVGKIIMKWAKAAGDFIC